jgi:hypothetical protein
MVIVAWGLMGGCGRKAPPEPPLGARPAKVKDLSFSLTDKTIKLSWTIPLGDGKKTLPISGFLIYRSRQNSIEKECPNCPLRFVEVGDVPAPAAGSATASVIFTQPIEPGYRYVYKVVAYTDEGRKGRDSNRVDFEY